MSQVSPHVISLEEGVLRVLYEEPASALECAARLLGYGYAAEVVTDEVETLLAGLALRACVRPAGDGTSPRYALTAAGSERLASLVEAA